MKAIESKVIIRVPNQLIETAKVGGAARTVQAKRHTSGFFAPVIGNDYQWDIIEQTAKIVAVCDRAIERVSNEPGKEYYEHPVTVEKGDTAIVHHHVIDIDESFTIGNETYCTLPYWKVFGVIKNGTIVPNTYYNFLKPIKQSRQLVYESGFQLPKIDRETNLFAEMIYPNPEALRMGIKPGDTVMLSNNTAHGGEYDIKFHNERLLRVRTHEISCKVKNVNICEYI